MTERRKTGRSSSPPRSPEGPGTKRQRLDKDPSGAPKRETAASKKEAAKATKAAAEAKAQAELQQWIESNDPMLCADVSVTIDQLFINAVKQLDFPNGSEREKFDWSAFRQVLEHRSKESPDTLFIQCRQDDLVLDPDGLTGISVDNFVVVSCSVPTLAPRHYIVREHRPNADIEDNAPERVKDLQQQSVKWIPITKSDGSSIKAFLLQRPDEVEAWAISRDPTRIAKSVSSFNFGFGAPAPTVALPSAEPSSKEAHNGTSAPSAAATGFGTPTATSEAPKASLSFGFGSFAALAPSTPQAAPVGGASVQPSAAPSFSFGLKPAGSVADLSTARSTSSVNGGEAAFGSTELQLKVPQLCFTLWSSERVKEMRKDLKAGTRIVRPQFPLDESRSLKIVMQSDMADSVEDTARDLLLKVYAKESVELKKLDAWIDECPRYNDKLQAALQKFRGEVIKQETQSEGFTAFSERYYPKVLEELTRLVEERRKLVQEEESILQQVAQQLKEGKIAEKSKTTIYKYYPSNRVCRFRPHGKVTGITEAGEAAFCEPPAYVFVNPLLASRP